MLDVDVSDAKNGVPTTVSCRDRACPVRLRNRNVNRT